MSKIKKFIEDNKLDFTGSGSELNSNCCILAGYACYLGFNNVEFANELKPISTDFSKDAKDSLEKSFFYAYKKNYGENWVKGKYEGKFIY